MTIPTLTLLGPLRAVDAEGRRTFDKPGAVRGAGKKGAVGRISRTIAGWIARSRQRRALREIAERTDDYLLKDIGVSREEAFREADKPFWRP